jgi:Na+(H+)/acetate symporter ActP
VLAGKRDAAIGTIGVVIVAVHLVLAVVGAVGLTDWVSGLVAGLLLIGFVVLHAIIGSRIGHRLRRQRRDHP